MAVWWVNHKQTVRQEVEGGYIWSPKTKSNGQANATYDTLRRVVPGDLVFSYAYGEIRYVGIATHPAASCPKPEQFGQAGLNWDADGWMVPIAWHTTPAPLIPKEFLPALRPFLPDRHSPIHPQTGRGAQNVYLAAMPDGLGPLLLGRLGAWGTALQSEASGTGDDEGALRAIDDAIENAIREDLSLDDTVRRALVAARRGQGRFRQNVEHISASCRVTGVADPRLLRASHIKPWRACETPHERLDGNNGLLLSPNIDLLFDLGYISFRDDGTILLSPRVAAEDLARLGVPGTNPPRPFTPAQAQYLAYHRGQVFLA